MPKHLPTLIALIAALLTIGLGSSQALANERAQTDSITTVSLHSTVRLASDHATITLADLADISGPQAPAIEELTIQDVHLASTGHWSSIKVGTIRALIEQSSNIREGSVVLEGGDVALARRQGTKESSKPIDTSAAESTEPSGPTLRDQIEQWIYARPWLKSDAASTRLIFNDRKRDQDLLNTPIEGRTVILNEIGRSKMISCEIVIYENDRLIVETTIRFDVQIKRKVRVSTSQIRRNELISDQHSVLETRWLSPMVPVADPDKSLGQTCKKTINPGSILLIPMVEQPILVKRNRIVSARSLSGSVSVTMSVRALDNGRLGEFIELESRNGKNRFTARVAGPNRVIIVKKTPKTSRITPDTPPTQGS